MYVCYHLHKIFLGHVSNGDEIGKKNVNFGSVKLNILWSG